MGTSPAPEVRASYPRLAVLAVVAAFVGGGVVIAVSGLGDDQPIVAVWGAGLALAFGYVFSVRFAYQATITPSNDLELRSLLRTRRVGATTIRSIGLGRGAGGDAWVVVRHDGGVTRFPHTRNAGQLIDRLQAANPSVVLDEGREQF